MTIAVLNYNNANVEIIRNIPNNLQNEDIEKILVDELGYNSDEIYFMSLKPGSSMLTMGYNPDTKTTVDEDETTLEFFSEEFDTEEDFLEDLDDSVESYFRNNCDEDGYDSFGARVRDMEAMASCTNDSMVDDCIDKISEDFDGIDLENYRDRIENKLSDLAVYELS